MLTPLKEGGRSLETRIENFAVWSYLMLMDWTEGTDGTRSPECKPVACADNIDLAEAS